MSKTIILFNGDNMDYDRVIQSIKNKKKNYLNINSIKNSKYISNLFSRTLIAIIIILLSVIYINMNNKNLEKYKINLFEKNFSFSKISNIYNKYFGKVIPIEIEKGTTKMVFNEKINYDSIDKYENGFKLNLSNSAVMSLSDGIVVFIGEKEGYGNTIIVQGSDGVDIWYGNIENIGITLYDYIEKGTMLGEGKDNSLYLVFNKENEYLSYEEYLK